MPFSGTRLLSLVPSAALVVAALALPVAPAQADRSDAAPAAPAARVAPAAQALIEAPAALDASAVAAVDRATGAVRLRDAAVTLVPPAAGPVAPAAGTFVSRSAERGFSVASIPTAAGVQMVLTIDSAASPQRYAFGVRAAGVRPTLADDGGIALVDRSGQVVGGFDRPWAYDAAGRAVATRYVVRGSTITQVVEHGQAGISYPVTADPKVKSCNFYTATCIKFSKSEVAKVAKYIGLGKGVSALCALIPGGVLGKVACGIVVTPIFNSLSNTFKKAKKQGKCVELKLNRIPPAVNTPIGWKVVGC